jgi:putative OPT family oligopeptide transporter
VSEHPHGNNDPQGPLSESTIEMSGEVLPHDGLAVEDFAARVSGEMAALEDDPDALQRQWFEKVYQGDHVPQLTLRAVLLGGILGSLMCLSNLYTMLKVGWGFGVAITACVLSYVIWNGVRTAFPRVSAMTILENNCMQSTASAAGYSTGSTICTAFGAYLLITGHQIEWQILLPWTFITAALGVFLAVPMKRQMINHERLPFPSGIAAAETLRSLYSKSKQAVMQAYALVGSLIVGGLVGFFRNADFAWQKAMGLKIPELLPFPYTIKGGSFPLFGFEPSVLLIAAGMIVGMRVSVSMFLGSILLYLVVGPAMVNMGVITNPAKLISGWGLWTGTAIMVTSGLTAFGLQWKTIARSFGSLKNRKESTVDPMDAIEVPTKWFVIGVIPLGLAMALLQYVAFSIALPLGIFSVVMSFFLALVAARSTGETDITPIGAMGKITQLAYAALAPANATTNLMTASVTANTAIASSDLLTDLKSGYLLGANPRRQFIAQFVGIFFGTAAVVPAWYLMVPTKAALEAYNPPSTNMWLAVAQALTHGISYVPETARWGMLIGGILGILLACADHFFPKFSRRFLPSAMGLGLAWVVTFANAFAFLIGAVIAMIWQRLNKSQAETFVVPVASGAIAGESLACALIAIIGAVAAMANR